jgi:hypothetical protein
VRGFHSAGRATRPASYPINIQPRHGDSKMAKPVQVKQVIDFIDSQKEK